MVRRFLCLVALLLASAGASALVPKVPSWTGSPYGTSAFPTCEQAIAEMLPVYNQSTTHTYAITASSCTLFSDGSGGFQAGSETVKASGVSLPVNFSARIQGQTCPANSAPAGAACQCGAGFTESGGQCVSANACAANKGKTTIVNWTVGFTRSPDSDDTKLVGASNPWPGAGEVCNAGCLSSGDPYNENSQAFKSQVPTAQGLYRLSMDIPVTNSGDACTPSAKDQAMSPAAAEPPCPGYVGEVNGRLGCYGTADKPVNPTNSLPPPKPPIAGNPPAGPKPPSGEGSGQGSAGRTPSGGSGGNAGGPAAAGAGGQGGGAGGAPAGAGSGSGTGGNTGGRVPKKDDGTEQAECGAPEQPVCAVKVDENGTPSGGGDGMKLDGLNTAMDQAESKIKDVIKKDGMDTSWVELPNWLSSQDCSPWQFGTLPIINMNLSLNICAMQPFAVMVMSFLWVVGTFFAIVSMVGRVVGAGVH